MHIQRAWGKLNKMYLHAPRAAYAEHSEPHLVMRSRGPSKWSARCPVCCRRAARRTSRCSRQPSRQLRPATTSLCRCPTRSPATSTRATCRSASTSCSRRARLRLPPAPRATAQQPSVFQQTSLTA